MRERDFLAFTNSPHFSFLTTPTLLEPSIPEYDRPYVIRSKGFFWLASRTDEMMLWYVCCTYARSYVRTCISIILLYDYCVLIALLLLFFILFFLTLF